MPRHYINHPRNYEQLSLVGVKVGTGAINNEQGLRLVLQKVPSEGS